MKSYSNPKKSYALKCLESMSDVTPELLGAITEDIALSKYYAIVAICAKTSVGSLLLAGKQKNTVMSVMPLLAKINDDRSDRKVGDVVIIDQGCLERGIHLNVSEKCSFNSIYEYFTTDGNGKSDSSYTTKLLSEKGDTVVMLEFKIVPVTDIVATVDSASRSKRLFETSTSSEQWFLPTGKLQWFALMDILADKEFPEDNSGFEEFRKKAWHTNKKDAENVEIVKLKDILDDLNFKSANDYAICKDIILDLERFAAYNLKNEKNVALPFLGNMSIDFVKRKLYDFIKTDSAWKAIAHSRNDAEAVAILKEKKGEFEREFRDKMEFDRIVKELKKTNKEKYERLCITCGKTYADIYMQSLLWLEEVPFDEEFEEAIGELDWY